jgi:hypothetical protein
MSVRGLALGVVALAVAACQGRAGLHSAPVQSVPSGWRSYSHGALSVAVPDAWTVIRPQPCASKPGEPDAIEIGDFHRLIATDCPTTSGSSLVPLPDRVTIECLYGSAREFDSNQAPSTQLNGFIVHESTLGPSVTKVYVADGNASTDLVVATRSGQGELAAAIIESIRPTYRRCPS